MKIIKTFKTRIYPKKDHIEYFRKAFGIRRWLWNWGVSECSRLFNSDRRIYSAYDLALKINNMIKSDSTYIWIKDINSMIMQEVFDDLQNAYKAGFKMTAKYGGRFNHWMPKFRKLRDRTNSFRIHEKSRISPSIRVSGRELNIQTTRAIGRFKFKTAESIDFIKNHKICYITIKEDSIDAFYVYITYEKTNHIKNKNAAKIDSVGIDMGIKTPLSCIDSNGKIFNTKIPKTKIKQESKTDKYKSRLYKKVYNSRGYKKIKKQLQKSYIRETNIMQDFRNKIILHLVRSYTTIKIEPYNHSVFENINRANRAELRFGAYDFIDRLKCKSIDHGCNLIIIPQGEKTTQTCSDCGAIKCDSAKLKLGDSIYKCAICGKSEDRDLNAARNILKYV